MDYALPWCTNCKGGGDVQLNGQELLSQAQEKQRDLMERMDEFVYPAFFEVG
jgi:hypothetical protein